jgi:hypothetical protein
VVTTAADTAAPPELSVGPTAARSTERRAAAGSLCNGKTDPAECDDATFCDDAVTRGPGFRDLYRDNCLVMCETCVDEEGEDDVGEATVTTTATLTTLTTTVTTTTADPRGVVPTCKGVADDANCDVAPSQCTEGFTAPFFKENCPVLCGTCAEDVETRVDSTVDVASTTGTATTTTTAAATTVTVTDPPLPGKLQCDEVDGSKMVFVSVSTDL